MARHVSLSTKFQEAPKKKLAEEQGSDRQRTSRVYYICIESTALAETPDVNHATIRSCVWDHERYPSLELATLAGH